jgi:hypothetical protein
MSSILLSAYLFTRKQYVGFEEVSYTAKLRPEKLATYDRTEVEPRLPGLVPDIILRSGEHQLVVEVAVTHRVDDNKLSRVESLGLPAVEIRLNPADACLSREELRSKLGSDIGCKHWLFHPNQREHEEAYRERVSLEEQRQRDEGRERRRYYRETLMRALRPAAASRAPAMASSMKEFLEKNAEAEAFNSKHGRYVSLDEMRKGAYKPRKS